MIFNSVLEVVVIADFIYENNNLVYILYRFNAGFADATGGGWGPIATLVLLSKKGMTARISSWNC